MSKGQVLKITTKSTEDTISFGERLGKCLSGGEVIELVSDVGGGKTTLVRGMASGIGSSDQVQSPTFTLQRIYRGDGRDLHHFDFYRLSDPGVLREQIFESIADPEAAVVIEWAGAVNDVLPEDRLRIEIAVISETGREMKLSSTGGRYGEIIGSLR